MDRVVFVIIWITVAWFAEARTFMSTGNRRLRAAYLTITVIAAALIIGYDPWILNGLSFVKNLIIS